MVLERVLNRISQPAQADSGPPSPRVAKAIVREESEGLAYTLWGRLLVLGLLALWVLATLPLERSALYLGVIVAFAVLGIVPHLLHRLGLSQTFWAAVFLTLDVALLVYVLIVPTAIYGEVWSPQLNLRLPGFLYLGIFLVGMALSYSPTLVVWTGVVAIVAWSAGTLWVLSLPDTFAFTSVEILDSGGFTELEGRNIFLAPDFVSPTLWYNRIVFLGLVTLILAIAVWRSRRLVWRQVAAEAARANLARYFSPNMVEQLAASDDAFDRVDERRIAVLFVDIVGFTDLSERLGPDRTISLLRSFHGLMAKTVFDHGGTIDKYMGDAVMANFGTPMAGREDAANALRCAYAMLAEAERWNGKRAERGAEPVEIGIGIHFGEVVTGNIGDKRHLEYAVIGDTVNVASRLERLTREVASPIVVSAELVGEIRRELGDDAEILNPLREDRETTVRGREAPIVIRRVDRRGSGLS